MNPPVISEVSESLPLAVQNGFNLIGPNFAQGVQLDVIGKYVGVTRSGHGFAQAITLNDADFLQLIRMAIVRNFSGSSLAEIVGQLFTFFGHMIAVFDHGNMRMSFLISSSFGNLNLVQLFVTEGLLPVPMAVAYSVFYVPATDRLFGFRTYEAPGYNVEPFNSYGAYVTTWPWLSYANAVLP